MLNKQYKIMVVKQESNYNNQQSIKNLLNYYDRQYIVQQFQNIMQYFQQTSDLKIKFIPKDDTSLNEQFDTKSQSTSKSVITTSSFITQKKYKKNKYTKQLTPKKFSWSVYKLLLMEARKQTSLLIIALFTLISSAMFTSSLPYMAGIVLDDIATHGEDPTIGSFRKSHGQLLALIIGLAIVTYIRSSTSQILQERIAISLRIKVFSSFITNDIYFFEKHKTGELNSRLGNDINQAKSAASNNLTFLLRNILTITFNIMVLMFMSWNLTLLCLIVVPFYYIVIKIYNKYTKVYVRKYQDILSEASSHVNQVFSGINIVKAFGTQEKEINKYAQINKTAYSIIYKKAFFHAFHMMSSVFLPNIGVLIVLWYGGYLVMTGTSHLTTGQFTSFIMYCMSLQTNATAISESYSNIINGTSAVSKVFELIQYKPQIMNEKLNNLQDKIIDGDIEFVNVKFKYPKGDVDILKGLNLHIRKGEYVAFVGQSGSGKSTIVKLIERFYEFREGDIFLDDMNIKCLNVRNVRDQIGFVSQDAILFSGTIQENITYGVKDYSYDDLIDICVKTGCMDFIANQNLFPDGFKTTVGQKGNQLSGGQRQRISIARALMRKPKILIFDQATSALDSNSQFIVQQSIQALVNDKQKKITIIIIAHRLSTIINAQRIFVMKNGEIIQQGNHQTLLDSNGYYSELVSKQLQSKLSRSRSNQVVSDMSLK